MHVLEPGGRWLGAWFREGRTVGMCESALTIYRVQVAHGVGQRSSAAVSAVGRGGGRGGTGKGQPSWYSGKGQTQTQSDPHAIYTHALNQGCPLRPTMTLRPTAYALRPTVILGVGYSLR
eukprot:363136-Chlamydomonas_euryale.AAC.3